jgi:hypothetical protein
MYWKIGIYFIVPLACLLLGMSGTSAANLSLAGTASSPTVGEIFNIQLLLDPQGQEIAGVDVYSLNYDSNKLEVIDADPIMPGIQIVAGDLMPYTMANIVDTVNGRIIFSQVSSGGDRFSSATPVVLATAVMRAKSPGQSSLYYSFAPSSTTDTNVSLFGADILASVSGLSVKIKRGETAVSDVGSPDLLTAPSVVQTSSRLNVRSSPGLNYSVIATIPSESRGIVTGDSVVADGYTWHNVSYENGTRGWSASKWLLFRK